MRLLCFGDLHAGAGYDQDVCASLDQILPVAETCQLACITGDIYERASSPGDRDIMAPYIQELGNRVTTIIVRGNHDAPKDIKIFQELRSKHPIYVQEVPRIFRFDDGPKRLSVHCLPWLTKANWIAHHPEASVEASDKTVGQMALEYLRAQAADYPQHNNILLAHLLINGAKAQNHQPLIGQGVTFGQYDLREAGFYAGIFGHIHLKQQFDNGMFFYPGSVAPMNYGETPEKYYAVLDTETNAVEFVRLKTVHRCTIDVLGNRSATNMFTTSELSEVAGARVRANLIAVEGDDVATMKSNIVGELTKLGALEVKVNVQTIPKAQLRASTITQAQNLQDKLKTYWSVATPPDPATCDDMLVKLDRLEESL